MPFKCEICGSTDFVKEDGMFVCQGCRMKYTAEDAKKIMTDCTVNTPPDNACRSDTSEELDSLYQIARRAKNDNNAETAAKYYDMILLKDPNSWEAYFYVVFFKAASCKIAQIQSAAIDIQNCIDTVLGLIKNNVEGADKQIEACCEVTDRVIQIYIMLFNAAKNHYYDISGQIRDNYTQEYVNNAMASCNGLYCLGDNLDAFFNQYEDANKLSVAAWKRGIDLHAEIVPRLVHSIENKAVIDSYAEKIKKYYPSYTAPEVDTSTPSESGGCYVATAVYGSYDCPQVWTLRRYRDCTLAKTWSGRLFIRTYYAVSPTIVKWFGNTEWFKRMWRGKLDKMVSELKRKGVEDTPYKDKKW